MQKEVNVYQELDYPDRIAQLKLDAVKVEVSSFQKPMTEKELTQLKDEWADNGVRMADIESRKEKFMAELKLEIDPLKSRGKEIIKGLKYKVMEVEDDLFYIPDYENNRMNQFDRDGNLINSRFLFPEEKQMYIQEHQELQGMRIAQ